MRGRGAIRRREGRARAFALVEALVALAILSILLVLGMTLFGRRRDVEKERLDQEKALRALESEWAVLRTSPAGDLAPQEKGPCLGPAEFLSAIEGRTPVLTVEATAYANLVKVRLDVGAGVKRPRRVVQEGFVRLGGP